LIALAALTLLLIKRLMPYAGPSVTPGGGIPPLWDVYLGPVKLGRLLEESLRIEDHLGRLKRRDV